VHENYQLKKCQKRTRAAAVRRIRCKLREVGEGGCSGDLDVRVDDRGGCCRWKYVKCDGVPVEVGIGGGGGGGGGGGVNGII
jgi:hypothetical protein